MGVTSVDRMKGPQQLNLLNKTPDTLKATAPKGTRMGRGIAGSAIGSLAGSAVGLIANEIIASANRPQLPRLSDYQQ